MSMIKSKSEGIRAQELHKALWRLAKNKNPGLANLNVATVGPKGAGKDTLGGILDKYYNFNPLNFADLLKAVCILKYGLTRKECYEPALKEKVLSRYPFVTPRQLMQDEAETSRKQYPDIWVKAWENEIMPWDDSSDNILVTDLRYPNELVAFRKLPNNLIIYVLNAKVEEERKQGLLSGDPRWLHESESHTSMLMANADLMVVNMARTLSGLEESLFLSLHIL